MKQTITNELQAHIKTFQSFDTLTRTIEEAATLLIHSLTQGKKGILFGNGGSAADAQHISAELVGRYKSERKALPAITLTTDTSALTSIANDFGYEQVFARQLEGLANTT